MSKFLMLLKTLTAFRNLRVRNAHQPTTLSVAYYNPAGVCCNPAPTTNNFNKNIQNDFARAGSFFLASKRNFVPASLKEKKSSNGQQEAEQHFFELLAINNGAAVVPMNTHPTAIHHSSHSMAQAKLHIIILKARIKKFLRLIGIFGIALLFTTAAFPQTVVVNPTSPWTVPAGVTSIKVEVWGGGGGGGIGTNGGFGSTYGGGGGGGGAYNVATFSVTSGHTFTITIGSGGSGATTGFGGSPAQQGGISTVSGVDGTVSANGGGAGGNAFFDFGSFSFVNGSGGAGATGIYNGGVGGTSSGNGAGGGGGAGNAGDATVGSNTSNGSGGAGNPNSSPYIGGDGGAARTTSGTGNNAGSGPGGGGGGGRGNNNGGAGGAGQVVITYTACGTITASATYTDITCFNANNGTITVNGSGGTAPYIFSIDNGATYQPGNTFNNLPVGTYKIRVKDNNGCESKSVQ